MKKILSILVLALLTLIGAQVSTATISNPPSAGLSLLTPWTSNIDGGGYSITNILNASSTQLTTSGATWLAKTTGTVGIGVGSDSSAVLDVHQSGNTIPMIQAQDSGANSASSGGIFQATLDNGGAPVSGTRIGGYQYSADIGDAVKRVGSAINALATETWTTTANGTQLKFNVTANGASTRTTALLLDQNGNVGIATTTPTYKLSVEGSSTLGNKAIAGFFTATSTTATSTFAGSILVGTTTVATAKLEINDQSGSLGSAYGLLRLNDADTSGGTYSIRMDSPNPDIEFIETDQTAPAGKYELAVQGNVFQINARNAANDSFDNFIQFRQPQGVPNYLMSIVASTTSATSDALQIQNSISSSGAAPGLSWYTNTGAFKTARLSSAQGSGGAASFLKFEVSDSSKILKERAIIDTLGNFGVGTTTPIGKISIAGSSGNTTDLFHIASSTGATLFSVNKEGSVKLNSTSPDAIVGNVTLVAGSAVVTTSAATANSYILLTEKTAGGTPGTPTYTTTTGSFTITSSSGTDTSTYTWLLMN